MIAVQDCTDENYDPRIQCYGTRNERDESTPSDFMSAAEWNELVTGASDSKMLVDYVCYDPATEGTVRARS